MHCGLLMKSQRLPLTIFLIEDRHACVYLMSSALQHSKHGYRTFRIRRLTQDLTVAGDHCIGSQHNDICYSSFSTCLFRIKAFGTFIRPADTGSFFQSFGVSNRTLRCRHREKLLPHGFRLLR